MTTSPTTTNNDVKKNGRISRGELAYVTSRNQHTAHNMLLRAVKDSGKTQKELARLTGIGEATISRILRRPSNFEINTYSKLLYAACGAFIAVAPSYPQPAPRNVILASLERENLGTGTKTYTYRIEEAAEPHMQISANSETVGIGKFSTAAKTNAVRVLEKVHA